MTPVQISSQLVRDVGRLHFAAPVTHVYNPLVYAARAHRRYLERYAHRPCEVVLLGMNPGPWGMAQTGVPFGEVHLVHEWLGIDARIDKPADEHPKRPVLGFDCQRSEVSGTRLWGWAKQRFGTPERFFARFFVANYCPLLFLEATGRNRTPDKLPIIEREPLLAACDRALQRLVAVLEPAWVVGIGAFAAKRAAVALAAHPVQTGQILHPSPASPAANRGWAQAAEAQLATLGIHVP